MGSATFLCVVLTIAVHLRTATSQLPPRLSIPGAVLVTQAKPAPFRNQRLNDSPPPLRLRRPQPIPSAAPLPIRPVVEEPEEGPPPTASSGFDDEVNKLGLSALQSAVRQAEDEPQRPVHFRPERPVPVSRDNVRDTSLQGPRPTPALRHEQRENIPRPLLRQEFRDEGPPVRQAQPVRQQVRQQIPIQPSPQPIRQATRGPPVRQPSEYSDDEDRRGPGRTRKPPVQILRKYRTDNPDGSITWGFENEDGTFKEETLGVDCITRGKYGYVDPDGMRRQYSYETGNKCDAPEEEEEERELLPERPQLQPQPRRPPQFRPAP